MSIIVKEGTVNKQTYKINNLTKIIEGIFYKWSQKI